MKIIKRALGTAAILLPAVASAQTEPSDYTYATRYDLARRVVGTIAPDPDGAGPLRYAAVRNTYDSFGRLIVVEKGELSNWQPETVAPSAWPGFTVQTRIDTAYDAMDRKTQERTTNRGTNFTLTQISYDTTGRLLCTAQRMNPGSFGSLPASACDLGTEGSQGPDRITRNTYDAAGQLTQVRKAVGTLLEQVEVTYSYTSNGQQEYVIDANGNRARKIYDGYDRVFQWQFPAQSTVSGFDASSQESALRSAGTLNTSDYEQYGYDANNNRTSFRRRDGRVLTFGYDALNRMIAKVVPEGCPPIQTGGCPGASSTRDVYYGYNPQGLQTYARFATSYDTSSRTDLDGVTNVYDGFGQVVSSTTQMSKIARTVSSSYDANGNRTELATPGGSWTYTYDGLDRLIGLYEGAASSSAMSVWTYNPQGLLQGVTERYGSSVSRSYDGVGRLSSQSDTFVGGVGNNTATFEYNSADQIVKRGQANAAYALTNQYTLNRGYSVNGLNQYASSGANVLSYDANGNLIAEKMPDSPKVAYVYDVENRLVQRQDDSLVYDPLGRLFQVSNLLGSSTQFIYDGDQLIGEYNNSGILTNSYVHGPGDDDPLLWYPNGEAVRWYHRDNQGSITATATGASGTLQNINTYDDYGIRGSGNAGRFQYTGQIWIPELGIYHYKARAYSPTLGRFLQTDPIGYEDQFNLYAYVANDPVNGRDPTGLAGDDDWQKRVVEVVIGTAKVATGAVLTAAGIAGDGASAAAEVATAGAATPLAVPAAVASTAVAATGIAMAADGAAQISGAIMRSTPAGSDGGSNDGGNSGSGKLSGHAQDRMGQRGVSPERVQEAQQLGRVKPGNTPDTVVREIPSAASQSGRGVRIVMDRATGRVITVIDKGSKFK